MRVWEATTRPSQSSTKTSPERIKNAFLGLLDSQRQSHQLKPGKPMKPNDLFAVTRLSERLESSTYSTGVPEQTAPVIAPTKKQRRKTITLEIVSVEIRLINGEDKLWNEVISVFLCWSDNWGCLLWDTR